MSLGGVNIAEITSQLGLLGSWSWGGDGREAYSNNPSNYHSISHFVVLLGVHQDGFTGNDFVK